MCRYGCMLAGSGSKAASLTRVVWSRFWRQILYFLSGLTCTDENFITKAGAPRVAAAKGIALVCPDTSPRGANIEGEDESWDFGTGPRRTTPWFMSASACAKTAAIWSALASPAEP